ncbi:MAG: T9SS type A sorting domain-containing protein [Candidatus Stygibacter australis]|nr:T9SS type A sorting domain-containing protein [Candidatus Stygibacter australis]
MRRNSICLLFIILLSGSQVFAISQTDRGYYLQPSPEVEVTGRVVGSDFPDIGIANAEVTLTGMGTHTGITDEDGYFMIDTVYSDNTYEMIIEAEGYQVFIGEAVIGADDTDLGDIIINEIVFPAYDVIAAQNEYETLAEIIWHSPGQGLVEDYKLYRLLLGDEENEENWIMVAEGISDTVYSDLSWATVEMGVYRYAIKAEYLNNVLSESAFSNWLGKDMLATLEVTLTTNIGDIPEGAIITLEATEPDPDGNYPNPFNPVTNICYEIEENGDVLVNIYNLRGQKVETLVDGYFEAGKHAVIWDADKFGSGIYFVYFESDTRREVKKITILT